MPKMSSFFYHIPIMIWHVYHTAATRHIAIAMTPLTNTTSLEVIQRFKKDRSPFTHYHALNLYDYFIMEHKRRCLTKYVCVCVCIYS